MSYLLSILLLLPLVISCGCGGSYRDDPSLRHIGESLSDAEISEPEALSLLDTLGMIPDKNLSEGERHYRDFLAIKAADKGYVKHTSDSLYLTVKDYFSSRYSRDVLPEVLYYGGRVYSDMGNYPVALQYFQEALDCTKDDPDRISLRGVAASQTGRLLSKIRLYADALPYVEESLRIEKVLADTLAIIYDMELAGHISASLKDYRKAREYFEKACCLSKGKYPSEYAINRFRDGYVAYEQGEMEKALPIIRETMNEVDSMRRNYVLPVAAQAYLKAGIVDTAYIYAVELISNPDSLNKDIGYHVLLSDRLRGRMSADTVAEYFRRYNEVLDKKKDANMMESAIIQNTLYNYNVHDIARQKAEKERDELITLLTCLGLALALVAIAVLIYLWRKEKRFNGLYRRVARISIFKRISSAASAERMKEDGLEKCEESPVENSHCQDKPRPWQKESLLHSLDTAGDDEAQIRFLEEFHGSPLYLDMMQYIEKKGSLEGNDSMWGKIEGFFSEHCPDFVPQLTVLTAGRLTKQERQTAMLIKLGIRTNDIAALLSKSKGTIVSRRDSLSLKIYGEKKGSRYIDGMIRLL